MDKRLHYTASVGQVSLPDEPSDSKPEFDGSVNFFLVVLVGWVATVFHVQTKANHQRHISCRMRR